MKITMLGTGTSQGVPVIACDCVVCRSNDLLDKRLRSAILVETAGKTLVVDTGPDFRQQMLRENVRRLDAVLLTHRHKDHIAGLDDVRSFNFRQQQAMPVYADARTIAGLRQEFAYIFDGTDYPGIPRLDVHEITDAPFEVQGVAVTPIPVFHHKMPVLGFRFGRFAYVTDANFIPDASMERLYGLDVLVLNALQRKAHISHFTLDEAIELVRRLRPAKTWLTHVSHNMGLHAAVNAELPSEIQLAHDGLQIYIEA